MASKEIAEATALSPRKFTNIVHKLEELGAARRMEDGRIEPASQKPPAAIAEDAAQQQVFEQELRRHRLEQMRRYAVATSCRREHILRYFGDDSSRPCGNCDRCEEAGEGLQKVA